MGGLPSDSRNLSCIKCKERCKHGPERGRARKRTFGGREKASLNEVVSGGLSNRSSHQGRHEAKV